MKPRIIVSIMVLIYISMFWSGINALDLVESTPAPRDTFCDIMIDCNVFVYDESVGVSSPLSYATIWPQSACESTTFLTDPDGWAEIIYGHNTFDLQIDVQADGYYLSEAYVSSGGPFYIGLSPIYTQTPQTPILRHTGDVNQDGVLTSEDAQLAFSIALGLISMTPEEETAADCNADFVVTAEDAQLIFIAVLQGSGCIDPL